MAEPAGQGWRDAPAEEDRSRRIDFHLQTEKDGRRCERCGVTLPPFWPAVYCSTRCAELDA